MIIIKIIIIMVLLLCILYNFIHKPKEIRETMIGGGLVESTLKDGFQTFLNEASKTASKEFVRNINKKFTGMSIDDKNKMKKKIDEIIENIHFLNNTFLDKK